MVLAHKAGISMATPRPGEPFEPGAVPVVDPWWRGVAKAPAGGWAALPTVAEPVPVAEEPVPVAEV